MTIFLFVIVTELKLGSMVVNRTCCSLNRGIYGDSPFISFIIYSRVKENQTKGNWESIERSNNLGKYKEFKVLGSSLLFSQNSCFASSRSFVNLQFNLNCIFDFEHGNLIQSGVKDFHQ